MPLLTDDQIGISSPTLLQDHEIGLPPVQSQNRIRRSQTPEGIAQIEAFQKNAEERSDPAKLGIIPGLMAKLADSSVVQGALTTAENPIAQLARLPQLADQALGILPANQPMVADQPLLVPYDAPGPSDIQPGSVGQGLRDFLQSFGSQMSTPGSAAQLATAGAFGPTGPVAQGVGQVGFIAPMITGTPETVGQTLSPDSTPAERTVGALSTLVNLLGARELGGELVKTPPSGIKPQDIPGISSFKDVQDTGGEVRVPRTKTFQETPIIGGEPEAKPLTQVTDFRRSLKTDEEIGLPRTEQPTGQISFRAPAESGALPSARQSANEVPINPPSTEGQAVRSTPGRKKALQTSSQIAEKGRGLGVKAAMERNREAGVFRPFSFVGSDFWDKTLGIAKTAKVEGQQLYNRIRNKLGEKSAGWSTLDTPEFKGFLLGQKRTPEEVQAWVEKNGPQVVVRRAGEGAQTGQRREAAVYRHNWYDNLEQESQSIADGYVNNVNHPDLQYKILQDFAQKNGLTEPKAKELLDKWVELRYVKAGDEESSANWSFVGPKKDMPGYVEGAVVLPTKMRDLNFRDDAGNFPARDTDPKSVLFGESHDFPPNTLGWFRGYMETSPEGKKTFHLIEVQSDWAQSIREQKESNTRIQHPEMGNHPLLSQWERLTLKAAIEHAKDQGADAIAVSDSMTARMTEGHDQVVAEARKFVENANSSRGGELMQRLAEDFNEQYKRSGGKAEVQNGRLVMTVEPYSKGMPLHYDETLPRTLEELTGTKGTKADFGKHDMAYKFEDRGPMPMGQGIGTKWESVPRKDLIFKNEKGEPKTTSTALSFDLPKETTQPTITGKTQYKAPGSIGAGIKAAVEKNKGSEEGFFTIPSPAKAVQATKDLVKDALDRVFGRGVNKSWDEHVKYFEAKQAGWTAPRHVAANEEVANKMINYASAQIFAPEYAKMTGSRQPIALLSAQLKSQALKDWIDAGRSAGLYQLVPPTGRRVTIGGQPAVHIPIKIKGVPWKDQLWVRKDLAPEVTQAIEGGKGFEKAGLQLALDVATEAQIIGPTDFVFHTGNMISSIAGSAGAKSAGVDFLRKLHGVKQLDALGRVGYEIYREHILKDPEFQKEITELARIGALRGNDPRIALLSKGVKKVFGTGKKATIAANMVDTNKWIRILDRAGRAARNRMYDNLVERGAKDSELDRREFVNKMGQYNDKLMSKWQSTAKQIFSQFVVAGRTFNRNAFQRVMMSNEVRSANPSAYWKFKALNMAGLFASLLVTPVMVNFAVTGHPFGRKGTPLGAIDTGEDGDDGRPIIIDPQQSDLTRRGLRITGIGRMAQGIIEDVPLGKSLDEAGADIVKGMGQPWAGPPARVVLGGVQEYTKSRSLGSSIQEAAKAVNPSIESYFEQNEQGDKGGMKNVGRRLGSVVGYREGGIPSHSTRVQEKMDKEGKVDFEGRVEAEQEYKAEHPMSLKQEARAAESAVKNVERRKQEINDEVPKEYKGFLTSRGLTLPGYDDKISYKGTKVVMNKDEVQRYKGYIQDADKQAMDELKNDKVFLKESPSEQKAEFLETVRAYRKEAHQKIVDEIQNGGSNPKIGSDKKKKYSFMSELMGE